MKKEAYGTQEREGKKEAHGTQEYEMKKKAYVQALVSQMRCKKAREAVAKELENHIEEAAGTYEAFGLSQEEACKKAIRQMGDPVEVGMEMDRIHRPRMEGGMLGVIFLLSALGLLVQYRLGIMTGAEIFGRQCAYTILGLAGMLAVYFLDYSVLGTYTYPIYGGFLLLILAVGIFVKVGAYRFQYGAADDFGMVLYLFVPVFGAILYHHRGSGYGGLLRCLMLGAIPLCLCFGWISLFFGQGGSFPLSYRLNLAVILAILLFLAVARGWFAVKRGRAMAALLFGLVGVPGIVLLAGMRYFLEEYQRARILAWILPGYGVESYGMAAARSILGCSRLVGQAGGSMPLMESRLVHREYVFAQLLAGFGVLAGVCVLVLLLALVLRIFHISVRQQNLLGQMAGLGCGLVFFVQILECILLNLGIGVETQSFLPFFSYGGSATVVCYLLLGVVLSIYRYKDIPCKLGMQDQSLFG